MTLSTDQTLPNRVGAGTAQMGSTAGVDTNDPLRPVWAGENYVWFPAVAGNRINLALNPNAAVTGISTYRVDREFSGVAVTAASRMFDGHSGIDAVGSGAYRLFHYKRVIATGVGAGFTTSNSVLLTQASMVGRVQLRVDLNTSTNEVYWYRRAPGLQLSDDTGWTLVETAAISVPGTEELAIEAPQFLGGQGGAGAAPLVGPIYEAFIRINGLSAKVDPRLPGAITADHATVNGFDVIRSATGLKTAVVTGSIVVPDGTDDLVQLQASDTPTFTASAGEYAVIFSGRWNVETAAAARIFSTESALDNGVAIETNAISTEVPRLTVGGASDVSQAFPGAALAAREAFVIGVSFSDGTATLMRHGEASTATLDYSGVGTITHATPRLFRNAGTGATRPAGVPARACIVSHNAMTKAEFDAIATKLIAGNYA